MDKSKTGFCSCKEFIDYISNFSAGWEDLEKAPDHKAWIAVGTCEALLMSESKFVAAVDGSELSYVGLNFLCDRLMQSNRNTSVDVVHVADKSKEYLPVAQKPDAVKAYAESKLVGSLSDKRYSFKMIEKGGEKAGSHICQQIKESKADFVVLGYQGRKGKKDEKLLASNVYETLKHGQCSTVVIKTNDIEAMPMKRPAVFVVKVTLDKASTKAFLDALRLSQPGDHIHVVYCINHLENADNIYTEQLKKKYHEIFQALGAGTSQAFTKFNDRECHFNVVTKDRNETVPQRIVRFLSEIKADFVAVGTNKMRVARGKEPVSSISLQTCLEADCNYIVSYWNA